MDLDKKINHYCSIIEKLRASHAADSVESKALKQAIYAYVYVMLKHREEYEDYIDKLYSPLSEDEQKFLDSLGPL